MPDQTLTTDRGMELLAKAQAGHEVRHADFLALRGHVAPCLLKSLVELTGVNCDIGDFVEFSRYDSMLFTLNFQEDRPLHAYNTASVLFRELCHDLRWMLRYRPVVDGWDREMSFALAVPDNAHAERPDYNSGYMRAISDVLYPLGLRPRYVWYNKPLDDAEWYSTHMETEGMTGKWGSDRFLCVLDGLAVWAKAFNDKNTGHAYVTISPIPDKKSFDILLQLTQDAPASRSGS